MFTYIIDFTLVAIFVIGITAINGVLTNGIGERFFGGKSKNDVFNQSAKVQSGWKYVGGKN
jgi:hypothetical protein